jgi:transcriptional regulator with XRE-family HTH domain
VNAKPDETARRHPVDRHVGVRIRQARKARGVSQERLAELLEITFQQVQKYERGVNRVSASRLWLISEALDVAPAYFFEGLSEQSRKGAALPALLESPEGAELTRLVLALPRRKRRLALELIRAIASWEDDSRGDRG